jgi:hypothetical protein
MDKFEDKTQKVEIDHEISEKRSVLEMQDRVSEPDSGDEYNEFHMSVMDWVGKKPRRSAATRSSATLPRP